MKFSRRRGYIEIRAPRLLYYYSKLTGTRGNAKMAALYPFIVTADGIHPKLRDYFINHELIHFAQEKEMLIVGHGILRIIEIIFFRLFKGKSAFDSYLLSSIEQEAYDNMFNLDYLETRKPFNHLRKYTKNKPVVWKEYLKKMLNLKGFPSVYEWTDAPGTTYPEHSHKGKVSLFITKGSVAFSGGIQKTLQVGDQFDVPIGVPHSAIVGPEGCEYVVGEEIEGDS